jgi:eukaryotic-like serine/threonine-protein kinase
VRAGDLIDDRFELERLAGFGGTSAVYRARDLTSSQRVALKFLNAENWPMVHRFVREARILSDLHHRGVVRYIAHGIADGGVPYLAMEWLDGESLSQRLARADRLAIPDALCLIDRVADALAMAHARGIVHRDLKPSNLFLVASDIDQVKILDFGLARGCKTTQPVTSTGHAVGTPGYMAPEQARGAEIVGAPADIFSLGCVLYECLTGQHAFVGQHLTAILAKVLVEQAPSARKERPEIPAALDQLLARMLAKNPEDRPSDARSLAAELAELRSGATSLDCESAEAPASGSQERKLLCVLLLSDDRPSSSGAPVVRAADELQKLFTTAGRYGGNLEVLGDGSIVIIFAPENPATDTVSRAAHCALAFRELLPDLPMALASGPSKASGELPVGKVIDRAATLLDSIPPMPFGAEAPQKPESKAYIRLDRKTAGLLNAKFELSIGRTGGAQLIRAKAPSRAPG